MSVMLLVEQISCYLLDNLTQRSHTLTTHVHTMIPTTRELTGTLNMYLRCHRLCFCLWFNSYHT